MKLALGPRKVTQIEGTFGGSVRPREGGRPCDAVGAQGPHRRAGRAFAQGFPLFSLRVSHPSLGLSPHDPLLLPEARLLGWVRERQPGGVRARTWNPWQVT